MHRLVALGRLRDDNIGGLLLKDGGRGAEQLAAAKGHIASDHAYIRVMRGCESGVQPSQGAAPRLEIRNERKAEEREIRRLVGSDEQLVGGRRKTVDDALDQRTTQEGFEGLVFAHAGGLPARLDDNAQHGGIIMPGWLKSSSGGSFRR